MSSNQSEFRDVMSVLSLGGLIPAGRDLAPSTRLSDLKVDVLDIAETLEDEFNLVLLDEEIAGWKTLADVAGSVRQ